MPLPTPQGDETQDEFISRCMGDDVMKADYADQDQRLAVCFAQWRRGREAGGNRAGVVGLPGEVETRAGGAIRVETRGLAKILRGHAIVFERLSEDLGGFREKIAPSALDRTLRDGIDLRALVGHNPERVLGRLGAGTLRVAKDATGLALEIDPPAAEAGIVESVQRGDITGMTFGFRTISDDWEWKASPPVRTVTDMLVREVSVVAFPAYPQTDVALRALRNRPGGSVAERMAQLARRARP